MTATSAAKCMVCTRDDFNHHLGSLEDIHNMWRFEALRKVGLLRHSLAAFVARGQEGGNGTGDSGLGGGGPVQLSVDASGACAWKECLCQPGMSSPGVDLLQHWGTGGTGAQEPGS